jgi:hypothetical protein
MTRIRFDGCDLSRDAAPRGRNVTVSRMLRLPPALAASATPRILELLGEPPETSGGRVLELGFTGIHARPLELAGWEVVVVEPDPALAQRARERGARVVDAAQGRFDAVVAPAGADLDGVDSARVILVAADGTASVAS